MFHIKVIRNPFLLLLQARLKILAIAYISGNASVGAHGQNFSWSCPRDETLIYLVVCSSKFLPRPSLKTLPLPPFSTFFHNMWFSKDVSSSKNKLVITAYRGKKGVTLWGGKTLKMWIAKSLYQCGETSCLLFILNFFTIFFFKF